MRDSAHLRLLTLTTQRTVTLIATAGMRGLNLVGMIVTCCATLHEVVQGICRGAVLARLITSDTEQIAHLREIRMVLAEACDTTKAECLAEIDMALAVLEGVSPAEAATPLHERVTGTGDMFGIDDLRRMFKQARSTGA